MVIFYWWPAQVLRDHDRAPTLPVPAPSFDLAGETRPRV